MITGFEQLSSVNINFNRTLGEINNTRKSQSLKEDKKSLKKACVQFESIFISLILKQMRQTIPKSDFLNGSKGQKLFTNLLDQELAKEIAKRQNFGIGEILYGKLALD